MQEIVQGSEDLSQQEIADRLGVPKSTVGDWIRRWNGRQGGEGRGGSADGPGERPPDS
ncbi:helix-turn-helix domain-containing protein [Streptomyces sp. MP131-18]|uniref:helix-turn-helix domain-containing protein n=1 Tax=Streptomyces sp. MP131-18 TaxID=1857892 RepID=UPI00344EA563